MLRRLATGIVEERETVEAAAAPAGKAGDEVLLLRYSEIDSEQGGHAVSEIEKSEETPEHPDAPARGGKACVAVGMTSPSAIGDRASHLREVGRGTVIRSPMMLVLCMATEILLVVAA